MGRKPLNPRPRFDCVRCGKEWADTMMVIRPEGRMCHRCYYSMTYGNRPPEPAPVLSMERVRDDRALRNRGMTPETYEQMRSSQNGVCAICRGLPASGLVIDHNHESDAVRGLLCTSCNTGLGLFLDDPELIEEARRYLVERGNYARRRVYPGTAAW